MSEKINYVERANAHLEKGNITTALFYIALEAIRQLTRIADALEITEKIITAAVTESKQ